MERTTFHKAKLMLTRDEELRRLAYDDKTSLTIKRLPSGGKVTVGIGRNLSDVPLSDAVITLMFAEDLDEAEKTCLKLFGETLWRSWSDNRRLGWLNMAFNLGFNGLSGFVNTLPLARAGKWASVETHLKDSLWYRQVGSRAERVIAMIVREQWPYA